MLQVTLTSFYTCCSTCLKWPFFLVLRGIFSLSLNFVFDIISSGQVSPASDLLRRGGAFAQACALRMPISQRLSLCCGHLLTWLFYSITIGLGRAGTLLHSSCVLKISCLISTYWRIIDPSVMVQKKPLCFQRETHWQRLVIKLVTIFYWKCAVCVARTTWGLYVATS